MDRSERNQDEYFATLPTKEFVGEAFIRIDDYYSNLETTGLLTKARRAYKTYYGGRPSSKHLEEVYPKADLQQTGEQGELTYLNVNHYRNLIKYVLILATSMRPSFGCRAANSDYKSQTQSILGSGVLDYYMREKKLERALKNAAELAVATSEGFVDLDWDPNQGEDYSRDPATGRIIREGDVAYTNLTLLDVVRDPTLSSWEDREWVFTRKWKNWFNLKARLGDRVGDRTQQTRDRGSSARHTRLGPAPVGDVTDQTAVWTFYHRKTEALPEGRMVVFLNEDTVLYDGPLRYRNIPVYRICAGDFLGSPFGYTPAFDALPLAEAVNILSSVALTNQRAFAGQNVWTKTGDNITPGQLSGALNHIQSEEMPQGLQLCKTPAEVFSYRNELVNDMETIFGVNSVVRGNPEASLKSGSALALVVSQAVQFSGDLQAGFNSLLEETGSGTLDMLHDHATTQRIASIVGKNNRSYLKEWSGKDLPAVNRVVVEADSAISKTLAGRVEIANQLLQTGLIKTSEQYLMVIATGRLEPMVEGQQAVLLLIRSENEDLKEGRQPRVIILDRHKLHIEEHLATLADPETRRDEGITENVLAHVQSHIDQWKAAPQDLLMALGLEPFPMGGMGLPPGMGNPSGGGAVPAGDAPPADGMEVTGPMSQEAQDVNSPNMPSLPPGTPPEVADAYAQMRGAA